jgi:orotidine-5'-phosphate decarboxylase
LAEWRIFVINILVEKIKKTEAPIVVGLDPMLEYVPEHILRAAYSNFGENPEGAAEAIWQYNKGIIDAIYDLVPAVKPQIAMYEHLV